MIATATLFSVSWTYKYFLSALHSTPLHGLAVWQICQDHQTKAGKYVVRRIGLHMDWLKIFEMSKCELSLKSIVLSQFFSNNSLQILKAVGP